MRKGLKLEEVVGFYLSMRESPKRSSTLREAGSDVFLPVPHTVARTTLR